MKIKYIANIFDKDKRVDADVEYAPMSVEEYFKAHIEKQHDVKKEHCIPVITGKRVEWADVPSRDDEIIFMRDMGRSLGSILSFVVGVILCVVGIWYTPALYMGAAMIAGALIGELAALFAPTVPTMTRTQDPWADSKTYSWNGIQNTIGEGSPIPLVYGKHRTGGVVIEAFISGDQEDGIQKNKFLNVLLALSEGEIDSIDTEKIFINKQEISLFGDIVTCQHTLGTNNQEPLSNFSQIVKSITISGAQLKYNNPYIYKTTGNIDAAIASIKFPALYQQNMSTGHIEALSVVIRAEFKLYGTADAYTHIGDYTFTESTKSVAEFKIKKTLPASGTYLIRLTRLTGEHTASNQSGDSYFTGVNEVVNAALRYPNTGLLGLVINATDKMSGAMPSLTAVIKGLKVKDVRNLNAEKAWSNNPANILYDLLISKRYGLGKRILTTQIDIDSFKEFADWCDELVTFEEFNSSTGTYEQRSEKRYEINLVLDVNFKAIDVIAKILGTCRAAPYWAGDKLKIVIDRVQEPVQMFSMGNIVSDSYEETYVGLDDIPYQVEAQILDEADNYERIPVTAVDRERLNTPTGSRTIQLYGLTTKHRAKRELCYAMRKAKAIRKIISWETGLDGIICEAGKLVLFQHHTPQYGEGGRLQGINGTVLTLQEEIELENGVEYRIRIRNLDGTLRFYNFLSYKTETTKIIDIGVVPYCAIDDIYQVGKIGKECIPLRVVNMMRATKHTVQITGEEYNESVFGDDYSIRVSDVKYSSLGLTERYELDGTVENPIPVRIANNEPGRSSALDVPEIIMGMVLSERMDVVGDSIVSNIIVDFPGVAMPPNSLSAVAQYEIIFSYDGIKWTSAGFTRRSPFEIKNAKVGATHFVAVKPITQYGVTNNVEQTGYATLFSITPTGVLPLPNTVFGFVGTQLGEYIRLIWDRVTNVPLRGYDIRLDGWETGIRVGFVAQNTLTLPTTKTGNLVFHIKAINATGNYAAEESICTVNVGAIGNRNIIFEYDDAIVDFPGIKKNFTVNEAANELVLVPGETRGEYISQMISFDESLRGRNYVVYKYVTAAGFNIPWDDADFTWDSDTALSAWALPVDDISLICRHEISMFNEMPSGTIDVIRLDGDTKSDGGITPSTESGVQYAPGAFHRGVDNMLATDLKYPVTFPGDDWAVKFHFTLKDSLICGGIARLNNTTQYLQVSMLPSAMFSLTDGSNTLSLTALADPFDDLLFIVSKSGSTFLFAVGNVTKGTIQYATGSLTYTKPTEIAI